MRGHWLLAGWRDFSLILKASFAGEKIYLFIIIYIYIYICIYIYIYM